MFNSGYAIITAAGLALAGWAGDASASHYGTGAPVAPGPAAPPQTAQPALEGTPGTYTGFGHGHPVRVYRFGNGTGYQEFWWWPRTGGAAPAPKS